VLIVLNAYYAMKVTNSSMKFSPSMSIQLVETLSMSTLALLSAPMILTGMCFTNNVLIAALSMNSRTTMASVSLAQQIANGAKTMTIAMNVMKDSIWLN